VKNSGNTYFLEMNSYEIVEGARGKEAVVDLEGLNYVSMCIEPPFLFNV
jgi:hypothetical protein